MTGRIFLNYRRADADAWADRIFERLVRHFPRQNVFMDIDGAIPIGFPWAQWLDSQVAACDLMLVLIGRSWVAEFQARADPDERDFVRVEIESALARKIPVVPVFLGDAPLPRRTDLPESVRPLLALQAARLQRPSFDQDAETLVMGVARSIALARGEAWPPQQTNHPGTQAVNAPLPPPDPAARWRAEGRIKVDARIVHGAPEGWFLPGGGKTEWFRDHDAGPEMVVVPAGRFWMGSTPEEIAALTKVYGSDWPKREGPRHEVAIAEAFAVGRFAVTFDEWDAARAAGGVKTNPDAPFGRGNQPVVNITCDDATNYCAWLSKSTGKAYRLLSEAEWEYVCRAGTATAFWWGDSISTDQANYDGNYTFGPGGGKGEYRQRTVPVDSFAANPWGLFQVHGNVWEWCADPWHDSYDGAPTDGSAWTQGGDATRRAVRGGSWDDVPRYLRSADRIGIVNRDYSLSFRVARSVFLPRTL